MKKLFLLIPILALSLAINAQTDFSSPYSCSADDATIGGDAPSNKVYLNSTADPHQIEWSDVSKDYTAVISWTVNATRPCYISASLDLGTKVSSNKHIFEVKVLDASGNELGAVEEGPAYTGDGFTEDSQVKDLSGKILLPAAGNYTVELRNNRDFCKGSIKNVILSYAGAAPVTDFAYPYSCAADAGVISGDAPSNKVYLNSTADSHQIEWSDVSKDYTAVISWLVVATRACYISASLDLGTAVSSNKHIFEVKVLDAEGNELGAVEGGPAYTGDGFTEASQVKDLSGKILLPATGVYTIELRNNRDFGKGSIKNVILSYAGAAPITDFSTPYSCAADAAALSGTTGSSFGLDTEASPHHIFWKDRALSEPAAASWNIMATRACHISASLDLGPVIGSNKHIFEVRLKDAEGNEIGMVKETGENADSEQVKALGGTLEIPAAGNYTIELKNNRDYGKGAIKNVILSYAGGDIVDIPVASLPFEDAILSARATRTLSPAEIHFGSPNADEYVQWNINASEGMYDITVNFTGTNHGIYKLDITRNCSSIFSESQGKGGSGSVTFSDVFIPSDGNYVLQLANTNPGADGYLTSVSVTASSTDDIFLIDEEETDGSVIAAKDDAQWKPLLKRSFTPGMFNTICVPFDSYDSELVKIFGTGYQLLGLVSATITDGILDLNFETIAGNNFAAGVPYLIKPTKEVSNPKFTKHTIHNYTSENVKTCGVVQFIGSFVATELDPDPNNLFLAANDKLYFPMNNAMPILGTRAYFKVSPGASSAPIRQARIVQQGNVVTVIDLVNGELPAEFGTINKVIENGQLLIIRDGVQYNALGVRIK